jgi:hypothetical protein
MEVAFKLRTGRVVAQSPTIWQSGGGFTAAKRGIGSVADAFTTVDSGAKYTADDVIDGLLFPSGGRPRNVGICAYWLALGFASITS